MQEPDLIWMSVLVFVPTAFALVLLLFPKGSEEGMRWWSLFGIGTFAFGFAFTVFEILVAVLQAYVFALLTAVYIQLAVAEEH